MPFFHYSVGRAGDMDRDRPATLQASALKQAEAQQQIYLCSPQT